MAANDVRNIERPTDLFQLKIVYRKTSIQKKCSEKRCSVENVPESYQSN